MCTAWVGHFVQLSSCHSTIFWYSLLVSFDAVSFGFVIVQDLVSVDRCSREYPEQDMSRKVRRERLGGDGKLQAGSCKSESLCEVIS